MLCRFGFPLSRLSRRFPALLLASGCLALSGASPSDPLDVPMLPEAPAAVQGAFLRGAGVDPALVAGNNGMGLTLLNLEHQAKSGCNVFLSPLSLVQALGMTSNGAVGSTRDGILQAMELGGFTSDQVNGGNAALVADLLAADPKTTLQIANSIWSRATILPGFRATNQTYYGAMLGDLSGAPASINAWVSKATEGHIPGIVPAGLDVSKADAILVNAIYFKGAWKVQFRKENTAEGPFHRQDGASVSSRMMHLSANMDYASTPLATLARLPYGNGRFAMLFVLPAPGVTLDHLVASLNGPNWNALLQGLTSIPLALSIPKFAVTWSESLDAPLKQMGMEKAFQPATADFSALAATPEHISTVLQKTVVSVDEAGTLASAATGVVIRPTGTQHRTPFVLDSPFVYAIQDTQSGALLFVGLMLDPTVH